VLKNNELNGIDSEESENTKLLLLNGWTTIYIKDEIFSR
jgi:hypothetical protein